MEISTRVFLDFLSLIRTDDSGKILSGNASKRNETDFPVGTSKPRYSSGTSVSTRIDLVERMTAG